MYGGQPPFRPPFAPTLQPGQGAPPGFPPFPPANGSFQPPPFAPNFPPGGGQPGYGGPPGFRPPSGPSGGGPNGRPAHPGIGLPPLPAGLPRPPSYGNSPGQMGTPAPGAPPQFRKEVKCTSVFVGGIAPGIADITLTNLLNACGPLHELKRVTGTSGKPQAFGFALFESPEVAMRCIRCLNGVELPDMTPEGRGEGKKKTLLVKVDDKTREFLEEFESTVGRSDEDENADASCRRSIAHIVALLTDPNAPPPSDFKPIRGQSPPLNVVVPAHLQDLKEGDLPENQRVMVLDQIAIFRVQAAKREREKAKLDTEKERQKLEDARAGKGPQMSNYGYGNRGLEQDRQKKQWGSGPPADERNGRGSFSGSPADGQASRSTPMGKGDAQGYDKPVGFVKAATAEGKGDERTDEEEEEVRRQRQARERDYAFRERERRVEDRERRRIDALNRENARRRGEADHEEKLRRRQTDMFEEWDDDEKMDKGRDWFYSDRSRWRSQRRLARDREFKEDLRDRHLEDDERRKAEADAEAFLKQQQIEFAEMEARQKARGLLTEDAAPVKLDINSMPRPAPKEAPKVEVVAPKPSVAFDEDEEMEDAAKKKKRTLVKLEYDADQPLGEEITEAERIARRNAKLLEVRRMVPSERRALWETRVEWAAINATIVEQKIKPFVRNKMKDLLGEVDEDLADFVLEHLRDHQGPDELVDGLEPVFAEESLRFVVSLWRQVVFESQAHKVHADTGDVLI